MDCMTHLCRIELAIVVLTRQSNSHSVQNKTKTDGFHTKTGDFTPVVVIFIPKKKRWISFHAKNDEMFRTSSNSSKSERTEPVVFVRTVGGVTR